MPKLFDNAVGWAVTGIFVFGAYAIAHYMMGLNDRQLLLFAGLWLWADMAASVNKDEGKLHDRQ